MKILIASPYLSVGGGIGRIFEEMVKVEKPFHLEFGTENIDNFIIKISKRPMDKILEGLVFKNCLKKMKFADKFDIINFHFPADIFRFYFTKNIIDLDRSIITVHTTSLGKKRGVYDRIPNCYMSKEEIFDQLISSYLTSSVEKKCFKAATHITTVSKKMAEELESLHKVPSNKIRVIENGINSKRIKFDKDRIEKRNTKPIILYIGGLRAQKGVFFAIEALKNIRDRFKFLIAGTGLLRNKISRKLKEARIDAQMLGFIEPQSKHLADLYANANILIMPSLYEGLPMVALEGMASGLPIVGFEGAVLHEIVSKENKQFICKDADVKALSKNIEILLNNNQLRKKIGYQNREVFLAKFTAEKMAARYYKFFKSIVK